MDVGGEEEIAQILLNMRVQDTHSAEPSTHSMPLPVPALTTGPHHSGPAAASSGRQYSSRGSAPSREAGVGTDGRRYGTRTAAGLKVGRRYTDLLDE